MDDEEYALSLWLAEVDIGKGSTFQKSCINSDASTAIDFFQKDLECRMKSLKDCKIANSLSQACSTDGNMLEILRLAENLEAIDHSFAPSSSKAIPSKSAPNETCASCMNQIQDQNSSKFPCGHLYCQDCFSELVQASLLDISLIPIRCCKQAVPQDWVISIISNDSKKLDRYMEVRECQSPSFIAKILDLEYEQTITNLGLRICPKCRRGVEKTHGCVHITCLCRHEFCYNCGSDWIPKRQCSCSLFSEAELDRIIVDRAPLLNVQERAALENVLRNHDQHQHGWSRHFIFNSKYRRCTTCGWVCNQWFHRCEGCFEVRCGRCTLNRD